MVAITDGAIQSAISPHALVKAVEFIDAICCVSATSTYLDELQGDRSSTGLPKAIERSDTAALFDWMIESFSFQGISNQVADNYLRQNGNATWQQIERRLAVNPPCPRLASYWTYRDCRYDKTRACCAEPGHMPNCPVPSHRLRNGRLNQTAYSLYLFIRDIAHGDFVDWVDQALLGAQGNGLDAAQNALVAPMRHIFGVSDKVLYMTLSDLLMAAPKARPTWFEVGSQMIVVDTLVHNFLHRSGILADFGAQHAYGRACYRPGGCADVLRAASGQIDAKRFNSTFPAIFPRFIQHCLWHYCAADGENICNGNKIDDRESCRQLYCILCSKCSKHSLFL